MSTTKTIFKLQCVTENPLFEGFAFRSDKSILGRDELADDFFHPDAGDSRNWKATRLGKLWKPEKVVGRVRAFNDYPCLDFAIPAFSRRAVDALRDYLEPNGELLPLISEVGEYYAYNITTVVDALNVKESKVEYWCDPPTTAVEVDHFVFHERKLKGLSIFRIVDLENYVFVTEEFVRRVHDRGLNGFHFIKVCPYPRSVHWRKEEVRRRREQGKKIKTPKGVKEVKGNTVVLVFILDRDKASVLERKTIARYKEELDGLLVTNSLDEPYFGNLEGHDNEPGEFRLFLSCPDADALALKLQPWIASLDWPGKKHLIKRYGNYRDATAREVEVSLE